MKESHPGFDQTAYLKKTLAKDSEKRPFFKANEMNLVSFRIPPEEAPRINATDNSLIELQFNPEKVGSF